MKIGRLLPIHDNHLTITGDALTRPGVWTDDSQVDLLVIRRGPVRKLGRVWVAVTEVSPMPPTDRCERCRFFCIVKYGSDPEVSECHRQRDPDPADPSRQFRPQNADNWCGRFQLRSRRPSSTPYRLQVTA